MMSFDTVSILEPNFKTSFSPICKIEVTNTFSCNVGSVKCTNSFDVAPGNNLHTTLDFITFLFESHVVILFVMLFPKITTFFFCLISVSLRGLSLGTVNKDSLSWLVLQTSLWFSIFCAWCFDFQLLLCVA